MSSLFPRGGGSTPIFDAVCDFLKDDDWNFQPLGDKTSVRMGFRGKNGSWQCIAQAQEDKDRFIFYSILAENVPLEKRQEIADFLTRANYGMVLGNFEMDFSDGEVRYKTSIDIEGGQLTPVMIKTMVYTNVLITDKYFPGIMGVVWGGESPAEAIQKIEGD